MEGRKSVGGKLEVKIRIRDPLKSKQVDEVKEKWLVIDQFIRTAGSKVKMFSFSFVQCYYESAYFETLFQKEFFISFV